MNESREKLEDLFRDVYGTNCSNQVYVKRFLDELTEQKRQKSEKRASKMPEYQANIERLFGKFQLTDSVGTQKTAETLMMERNKKLSIVYKMFEGNMISEQDFVENVVSLRRFYLEHMENAMVEKTKEKMTSAFKNGEDITSFMWNNVKGFLVDGNTSALIFDDKSNSFSMQKRENESDDNYSTRLQQQSERLQHISNAGKAMESFASIIDSGNYPSNYDYDKIHCEDESEHMLEDVEHYKDMEFERSYSWQIDDRYKRVDKRIEMFANRALENLNESVMN